MGVVVSGKTIEIPGLTIQSYKDVPRFALKPTDGRTRPTTWVRGIVLHTTRGVLGDIQPGPGPNHRRDERVAIMWSLDDRKAGAHLICDSDGSWVCTCDLARIAAYHAGHVNNVTVGIELYQEPNGDLYSGQLDSAVTMVDFLTRYLGIQRQLHAPYLKRPIDRGTQGRGLDMVGIYGHRDVSGNRGPGDPGDAIFEALQTAGYERFNFDLDEDRDVWSGRQTTLGLLDDGIPGPRTTNALAARGYHHGLWVSRPGD